MNKLIILCIAAVPTIDDEISAMEIDTLLHSGIEDRDSPYMGVFVSRADDVDKAEYLKILNAEGNNQYYRFLAELGIAQVEFVNGGSLAVEELSVPTRSSLEASLEKIELSPATQKILVRYILALPNDRKISALRRVTETAFLVNRFEYVESRSARPKFDGYVNHQRTPMQELDAVYRQLFQSSRPPRMFQERFDLSTVRWEESSTCAPSEDVPLKLIVPHDQAGEILQFLTDQKARAKIGLRLEKLRETTLPNLLDRYTKQYRDYFSFLYGDFVSSTFHLKGNLVQDINLVRDLRSNVLELYDHFRFPFPNTINPSFHIWIHDPELRVESGEDGPRVPFESIQSAMTFYGMVVSAFKTLPDWLYSGVLHDVVLYNRRAVNAYVFDHGRVMGISETPHASRLAHILEHEICHVADDKFHRRLRRGLRAIDRRRFTPEIVNSLTLVAKKFFAYATVRFTTYTDKGIGEMTDLVTQLFTSESQRIIESSLGQPQSLDPDLRDALSLLSHDDWNFLRDLKTRSARDVPGRLFALTGDYLAFFTSRYASVRAGEEAAELINLVVNPSSRAEAFHAVPRNDVKREKIKLTLSVLSGADGGIGESSDAAKSRVTLVEGWKQQEAQMRHMATNSKPIVVVYVSNGIQSSLDRGWKAANDRIAAANVAGNAASYIFLLREHTPGGRLLRIYVKQQIMNPPGARFGVIFYGIEDAELATAWQDLSHALLKSGLNFYGQLASNQEVMDQASRAESADVYNPCPKIRLG